MISAALSTMTGDSRAVVDRPGDLHSLCGGEGGQAAAERAAGCTTAADRQTAAALVPPSPDLPAMRDHRTCSDALVHAVSRSRAVAAAALVKSSSGQLQNCTACSRHHHQQQQQHHHLHPLHLDQSPHHQHQPLQHQQMLKRCPVHHSQCSVIGSGWALPCGAKTATTRKSHSQSSLARLAVHQHPHSHLHPHHSRSASSLLSPSPSPSRSPRRSAQAAAGRGGAPEEEVTYVWRDGRVQVQPARAARNGVGRAYHYWEGRACSGQRVEYLWHSGNVQKVVRGSNNELLSAEEVPPRGPVKGVNYCIVLFLLVVFVFVIIAIIFVLKVYH
ncbi:uncharacterized protein LOC143301213 [Babylonia areolata]|uniref:uncharacterized protein LOC143301213 n=1 Tax=Babylonia areolata TaxID=304850 RepID=UPI003FD44519